MTWQKPHAGSSKASIPSINTEEVNNRVQVGPSDNIQTEVTDAGASAIIEFESGTYSVSGLSPADNQTWCVGSAVKFEADADNPVIDLTGVSGFNTVGDLHITDPGNATTSTPGLRLDNTKACQLPSVNIEGTYHGIVTDSGSGDVNENWIGGLRIASHRQDGVVVQGETHDNHVGAIWVLGQNAAGNGIVWNTSGVQGGNRIGAALVLDVGSNGISLDNAKEVWFGSLLLDKCGGSGILFNSSVNRIFIGRLWSSTNGNNGVVIAPGSGNIVDDIHISSLYAWNNTNFGVLFSNGTARRFSLGLVNVNNNNQGANATKNLRVGNTLEDSIISQLVSYGVASPGVDVTGTITNSHVVREVAADGIETVPWTTVDAGPRTDYTLSNVTTDRSLDAANDTVGAVADVLGTLIADLQSAGLLE